MFSESIKWDYWSLKVYSGHESVPPFSIIGKRGLFHPRVIL